jgi:hypothetical protein
MSNEEKVVPPKDTRTDTTQKTGEQKPNFVTPEVRQGSSAPGQTPPKASPSGTPQEPRK